MMTFETMITLNNGVQIPQLGYGTALISENQKETVQSVLNALELGYRHLDTASVYYNETAVGEAIRQSGIPRDKLFVTTKLWTTDMRMGREYDAFQESLSRLGLDYVDLYLIHWPVRGRYQQSWEVLERIREEGLARSIGVSNFNPHHIDDIISMGGTVPAINQYQMHPQMSCPELRAYCQSRGTVLEAGPPLAPGRSVYDPRLSRIGRNYGKSAVQVVLRWELQHGVVTIPKGTQVGHIRENCNLFDFELNAEDMSEIDSMNINRSITPDADPETFTF